MRFMVMYWCTVVDPYQTGLLRRVDDNTQLCQ
jgi:hypothetical protein